MEKRISRREFLKATATTGAILSMAPNITLAQEQKPIQLIQPQTGTGNPFMQLLWKRMSSREFSEQPLPVEVLSNMLWSAFGINRPDGRRTAPSAMNKQEIDIYVALPTGLYVYNAKAGQLNPILAEDIRGMTGLQPYVKGAAANLVYVADFSKMATSPDDVKASLSSANAGFISENVYLYCASEGLATVARVNIDMPALAKLMKLRPDQKIVLAQSVGYAKKGK
ncbi:MAG TPA: nitroreductase family protein [Thermodesulfobacteriota bacterium]|jgi:nitroreductase|nr:nitroreductase family protein [Thermodesulfobacteriota bacterium]